MITEKVFSGKGMAPPPEIAKVLTMLLLLFTVGMTAVLFSMNMQNQVRFLLPIIFAGYYFIPKKKRPATMLVNKESDGEYYFSYRTDESSEEKKYIISEYSYWYKKTGKGLQLIFQIKTLGNKEIYLYALKQSIFNSNSWDESDDDIEYGSVRFEIDDPELLALKMDKSNAVN